MRSKKLNCPRCGIKRMDSIEVRNALSRRDNKTYICDICGLDEAFVDMGIASEREWVIPLGKVI